MCSPLVQQQRYKLKNQQQIAGEYIKMCEG